MADEDDFRLKAKARKSRSQSAEVHIPASYKGFYQEARIALVSLAGYGQINILFLFITFRTIGTEVIIIYHLGRAFCIRDGQLWF